MCGEVWPVVSGVLQARGGARDAQREDQRCRDQDGHTQVRRREGEKLPLSMCSHNNGDSTHVVKLEGVILWLPKIFIS